MQNDRLLDADRRLAIAATPATDAQHEGDHLNATVFLRGFDRKLLE